VGDRHRPRTGPDRPGVDGRPGRRRRGWLLAVACLAVVAGLVVLGLADGRLARRAAHKVGRVVFHIADRSAPTGTVPARVRPVALIPTADWAMYHGDVARSGVARGGPALRRPQLGWISAALDQPVYGQPLVVGGRVLVATQGDSVYALDERSGALLWRTKLGEPVAGGSLPCGNIDPVGVTSTPVADPAAGLLYVVGFLDPDHPHHELVALDLGSGAVRFRRPADPPGTDPRVHNQRGALVLANGRVYVAFGGRYGDCGRYHGWVVGLPASGDGSVVSFRVPTAREAGIWAPAGPVVDRRGELLVATGNGASSTRYDGPAGRPGRWHTRARGPVRPFPPRSARTADGAQPGGHGLGGAVSDDVQQPATFDVDQPSDIPGGRGRGGPKKTGLIQAQGGHAVKAGRVITSCWPCSATARITVAQPTPRSRATAATAWAS
jgi:PQQ-like domain